jgi:uncharacterized protein
MSFGWEASGAFIVASAVIWLGVYCTLLPVVPGPLVTWLGVLLHRLWLGADSVSWIFVGVGLVLMIGAQVIDYAVTLWGVRRFGTSWKGGLGAILGGICGIPFGPLGIIVGSVVIAMLFEWIELRDKCRVLKTGVGTLVSNLAAIFAKLTLTAAYAVAFYIFLPVYPWSLW